jgi:hypothetical protein
VGTLGKRWKLPPKVRALRYKRFMKTWKSKSRKMSKETKKKISKARYRQALNGRAPETSPAIRKKISAALKKSCETVPRHNAGISGYKNKGSFREGDVPYNTGKRMPVSLRRKLKKVWEDNAKAAPILIREHHAAVLKMAKKLKKRGLSVWTCLDTIPDLIIKKGSRLVALEVTRSEYVHPKRRNKHAGNIFDEVRWLNLDGVPI